ncbi:hypothetical protein PIB30_034955 [Stylosanthes scabra]|uniref:RNase H type-1 domain-containing protein n=1 Tax=Stylosanthes scabra TaxID=79078 RepID=A0ABU6XD33_9FABA|nr:hypothetical protein [Stylosanthes scabra]
MPQLKDKWESPPTNLRKINVDVATNGRVNGGVGAVVRDEMGFILAAATWPIPFPLKAHEAEALVAYWGLQLAKDCCFTEVILESDNIEVVKALKHGSSNETCFGSFIADTHSLIGSFRNVIFSHVKRDETKLLMSLLNLLLPIQIVCGWKRHPTMFKI